MEIHNHNNKEFNLNIFGTADYQKNIILVFMKSEKNKKILFIKRIKT